MRESQLVISWQALIIVPLVAAGVVVSLQWRWTPQQYETLVAKRVGALQEIEQQTEAHIPPLFQKVEEAIEEDRQHLRANKWRNLNTASYWLGRRIFRRHLLPVAFLVLYVIVLLIIASTLVFAMGKWVLG